MTPRGQLRIKLKTDSAWLKYRAAVRNSWPTEFDGYQKEITEIQKARPIRSLGAYGSRPTGKKLVEVTMADQSYRSRAVEIVMSVYTVKANLELVRMLTKRHIQAVYSANLTAWGAKGVREKDTVVNSLFEDADELLSRYQILMDLGDWVIADVDAGGFALQKAVKSLELATKREYGT